MKYLPMFAVCLLAACGNSAPPPSSNGKGAAAPAAARTAPATNQPSSTLVNPDFEQTGANGDVPGWNQTQHAGPRSYSMRIDPEGAYAGHGSFHITRTQPQVYGSLTQRLDAKPYAGKTVELSAMLKSRGVGPQGWALLISTGASGALNYSPGLTGDNDWRRESVRLQVPANAHELIVGATLRDAGDGWMDNVELKISN